MIALNVTDWNALPKTEHPGVTGTSWWQTREYPGLRIRLVEYSPGYKADHWCSKGHIVYCIEGEFTSHLKDGSMQQLKAGMSFELSDSESFAHMSTSEKGCKLFIVDGDFLK